MAFDILGYYMKKLLKASGGKLPSQEALALLWRWLRVLRVYEFIVLQGVCIDYNEVECFIDHPKHIKAVF